ncbi:carbon monoxide dehydrogenase subunit G [Kitasatospora sp. RB6PN24]|uniref:SRPBCC domain-containing protein n=1 Tax=Kitasatospora humi TaxID=2893891 RepID=UPI001E2E7D93|nr:SRPBCC domain-containing protein [Kitasatospora humi]MCC9311290.1 carbon monoxide dehydrogenase subunit G [Kitasatospora humi]
MEHEVVIPLPVELVQPTLDDPALLARCLPGLSTDASDAPSGRRSSDGPPEISGRLKLRIGSSTITYRGLISLIRSGAAGVVTAFVEGQEARGDGEVTATVRIAASAEGSEQTRLRFTGDLTPGGRLSDFDDETLSAAGRRLLDRFAAALGEELTSESVEDDEEAAGEPPTLSVVPDPEPLPDDLFAEDLSDLIAFSPSDDDSDRNDQDDRAAEPVELPYPHAVPDPVSEDVLSGPVRRSIVGRSAEEVDHAPPRGRYAPALPARSARARAASRWYGEDHGAVSGPSLAERLASPWVIGGGVALLGGAVIVARALRRR